MTWADPRWFWALLGVVALAALLAVGHRRHRTRLAAIFRGALLDRVLPPAVRTRRVVAMALTLLGLTATVVALAEPRFPRGARETDADGIDLVIAVDLSRSMDAQDVDPSRLERARRELLDLTDRLVSDRVGLVIFAGGAYPRMPLTADRRALELVVRELDTRVFAAQGSNVGAAVDEAVRLLGQSTEPAGKAVLVLTDGEVHDPDAALTAGRAAAAAGVVVYGMVVGTSAVNIPNGDGTFLMDGNTMVTTAPSDAVLTDLARLTGGAVARSVPGDEDTLALLTEMSETLPKMTRRLTQHQGHDSAVGWPLGVGVVLLLLGAWVGDGRRAVVTLVALFTLALAPSAHAQDSVADGDAAYRGGRYAEAVRIFEQLATEAPSDADVQQRLGAARYRAGDFSGAARAWDRASQLSGSADDAFNAGNAWWQSGLLERALDRYGEALERNPSHPGAGTNRDLLQQELQQRRLQQQRQQEQQSGGDPGDKPQDAPPSQGQPQQAPQDGSPDGGPPPESQPGQQGQQSQGQPQQGQGQPQPGQAQPSGDATDPQQRGQGGQPDDGTRKPEDPNGGTPDLDQVEGGTPTDQNTPGAGTGGSVPATGMTAEQARRTLEGVEEGTPRVRVAGERTGKPW